MTQGCWLYGYQHVLLPSSLDGLKLRFLLCVVVGVSISVRGVVSVESA